jgi:glycosyltransferase involved in cell wall biosynthesis
MESAIRASLVIPTLKREHLLRRLLDSLCAQATEHPFEVIVVNDSPEDDLTYLVVEYPQIGLKVVNLRNRFGRSIARNAGVRAARGSTIIFLDNDMEAAPSLVQSHLDAHTGPSLAVVGNIESAAQHASSPLARYVERQGAKKRGPGKLLPPWCFRTGNGSISKDLFLKAGMFDESFLTYGEDLDLAMRLHYLGVRFVFAEAALCYNQDPPDLDDMIAKMREYGRYTLPLFAKRHPDLAIHLWLPLAEPVALGREPLSLSLRKAALRVALLPPFFIMARMAYRLTFLGSLLFPVIDYIRLYSYFTHYKSALKER